MATRKARQSASETKLRASCDRCHELKNRCARGDTPDSRCERCERLDIDCVYSGVSRIGRPPGQKSSVNIAEKPENSLIARVYNDTHSIPGSLANEIDSGGYGIRTSSPESHRPTRRRRVNGNSNENNEGNEGNDSRRNTAGSPTQQETAPTCDLREGQALSDHVTSTSPPVQFGSQFWLDETMADAGSLQLNGPDDMVPFYEWLMPGSTSRFNGSDLDSQSAHAVLQGSDPKLPILGTPASLTASGEIPGASDGHPGGFDVVAQEKLLVLQDRLLKLQTRLGNLASAGGQSQPSCPSHVPEDEILASTQALLDITRAFVQLGTPRGLLSTGRDRGAKAIQSFPYPVLRSSSTASCHVTILQLLTCYAYILQILDPFVARLAMQLETPLPAQMSPACARPQSWLATAGSSPPGLSTAGSSASNGAASSGSSSCQAGTSRSPIFPESPPRPNPGSSTAIGGTEVVAGQAFTVGRFSFASQPALNADLTLRAIIHMIGATHTKINLLALGDAGMDVDEPQCDGAFSLGPAASSPVILSARAVMAVVHAKKRDLSQRMKDLTQEYLVRHVCT